MTHSPEFTETFATLGGQQLEFLCRDDTEASSEGTTTFKRVAMRCTQNAQYTVSYINYKAMWSEQVWKEVKASIAIDGIFKAVRQED